MIIQMAFRYSYDDIQDNHTYQCCTGTIITVRNGKNLQKGNKFHKKSGVAEVKWHANAITED